MRLHSLSAADENTFSSLLMMGIHSLLSSLREYILSTADENTFSSLLMRQQLWQIGLRPRGPVCAKQHSHPRIALVHKQYKHHRVSNQAGHQAVGVGAKSGILHLVSLRSWQSYLVAAYQIKS